METLIAGTKVPLSEVCPRAGCGQIMSQAHQEHVIIHRCVCGYESKTVTGESKLAYQHAVNSGVRIFH